MEGVGFSIHVGNLTDRYRDVVRWVETYGQPSSPRGEDTLELLGAQIIVHDPTKALPLGTGRGVSRAVAAIETLQLIGGFTDPVLTCKASDAFEKVKDGGAFHGAYGPRAAAQFPRVIERLQGDPASRRAIITIWDPVQDMFREGLHDYPCTVSLEYTIRNDKLIAQTHMRSNDVWLGLAYDAFVFTQVQLTLCHILGVEPGPYIHHASSLHLYERDRPKVADLITPETEYPLPDGLHVRTWEHAQYLAHNLVYNSFLMDATVSTNGWYIDALEKTR